MLFLNSIQNQSKKHEFPFDHWEYNNALTDEAIEEIIKADIPDLSKHNLNYDGTRAIDGGAAEFREGIASGGEAIKFRCFITKKNEKKFPNLVKFINELQSKEVSKTISKMINNSKRPLIIFPQGTRVLPDERPPFKKGASRIYEELKISCQPIAINSGFVWPKLGKKKSNGTITISILKPIPAGLLKEDFIKILENNIYEELNILN